MCRSAALGRTSDTLNKLISCLCFDSPFNWFLDPSAGNNKLGEHRGWQHLDKLTEDSRLLPPGLWAKLQSRGSFCFSVQFVSFAGFSPTTPSHLEQDSSLYSPVHCNCRRFSIIHCSRHQRTGLPCLLHMCTDALSHTTHFPARKYLHLSAVW